MYVQTEVCFAATLELENTGESVIHDASIAIELDDPDRVFELLGSGDRPSRPARSSMAFLNQIAAGTRPGDVFVRSRGRHLEGGLPLREDPAACKGTFRGVPLDRLPICGGDSDKWQGVRRQHRHPKSQWGSCCTSRRDRARRQSEKSETLCAFSVN